MRLDLEALEGLDERALVEAERILYATGSRSPRLAMLDGEAAPSSLDFTEEGPQSGAVIKRLLIPMVLSLLPLLFGLVAMGYASPPDPTWVHGIYDAADYDDIVVLITSGAAATGLMAPGDIRSILNVVASTVARVESPVSRTASSLEGVRAPPIPS